jgi:hypothetical protein
MTEKKEEKEQKPKKAEWKSDSSVTMTVEREIAWKPNKTIQMEIQETFQKKSKEEEKKK